MPDPDQEFHEPGQGDAGPSDEPKAPGDPAGYYAPPEGGGPADGTVEETERLEEQLPWEDPADSSGDATGAASAEDDTGADYAGGENTDAVGEEISAHAASIDWRDIGIAMKEAEGDRDVAAMTLGISKRQLAERIRRHPVLRSLYAGVDKVKIGSEDVLTRRPKDAPLGAELNDRQLAELVKQQDREIQLRGYEKLGVDPKTIKKLRSLDGLAKTMGEFLSESVKTSYQMFSIQQIHLFERAEATRDILATGMRDGEKITPDERRYLDRLYLDMIREVNRGHQMQFQAAAALTNMMLAAKGHAPPADEQPRRFGGGRKNAKLRVTNVQATPGQ